MSRYLKAPWRVQKNVSQVNIIYESGPGCDGVVCENIAGGEATWDLIASAPELYEACLAVVAAHDRSNSERKAVGLKNDMPETEATRLARAAVAKAEGRNP